MVQPLAEASGVLGSCKLDEHQSASAMNCQGQQRSTQAGNEELAGAQAQEQGVKHHKGVLS